MLQLQCSMHCAVKLVVLHFGSFLSWIIPKNQDELSRMRLGDGSKFLLGHALTMAIFLKMGIKFSV